MENNLNTDKDKIAARLKEARTLAGLSQAQAADKLGLQRPAISEIESGKRKVSADEIIQFAALYKVDRSWLLLEEGETDEIKVAARELSKLSKDDKDKLLEFLRIIKK